MIPDFTFCADHLLFTYRDFRNTFVVKQTCAIPFPKIIVTFFTFKNK